MNTQEKEIAALKSEIEILVHLLSAADEAIHCVRDGDAKPLMRYLSAQRRRTGLVKGESLKEQIECDNYFEKYLAHLRADTKRRKAAKVAPPK